MGTLEFIGPIDAASVQTAENLITEGNLRTLKITSRGGQSRASRELGELVLTHHMRVVVDRLCGSGCAHFVFAVAPKRVVMPGAIVLFHNTPAAMHAMVQHDPDPRVRDFFKDEAVADLTLYRRAGIEPALLLAPNAQMDVQCYALAQIAPQTAILDVLGYGRYREVALTAAALRTFGVDFDGALPESQQELDMGLQGLVGIQEDIEPTHYLITSVSLGYTESEAVLGAVRRCPPPRSQ